MPELAPGAKPDSGPWYGRFIEGLERDVERLVGRKKKRRILERLEGDALDAALRALGLDPVGGPPTLSAPLPKPWTPPKVQVRGILDTHPSEHMRISASHRAGGRTR